MFPTADGSHVSAESMLLLVEWIAMQTGEAVVDDEGRRKFGKHSWRSTGAVYLTGVVWDCNFEGAAPCPLGFTHDNSLREIGSPTIVGY